MHPINLIMICLLRSTAAALATPPRPPGGAVGAASTVAERRARRNLNREFSATFSPSSTNLEVSRRRDVDVDDPSSTTAGGSAATARDSRRPLLSEGHVAFRLARRTDVPQIQACNLATLPENYNANFYVNHMRAWPELTLVAEHIPEGCRLAEEEGDGSTITPLRDYWANNKRGGAAEGNAPKREIVGYVLGKVEERPINPQRQIFPPSQPVPLYDGQGPTTLSQYANDSGNNGNRVRFPSSRSVRSRIAAPTEKIGHVTSLAVHHHARRLGIASSLIRQLHFHLEECYGARSIGLHVRISNKAAVRLYCDDGYDVADIIPMYYGDGEDAYFMRKDFDRVSEDVAPTASVPRQQPQQQQRQWRRGEKERNEWLNRDARSGSFFDNRKSMRDTLSEEERAWVADNNNGNNGNPPNLASAGSSRNSMAGNVNGRMSSSPSLSTQFKRSVRTFFNGREQLQQHSQQQRPSQSRIQLPPWETGPEGLQLPRYSKVMRQVASPAPVEMNGVTEMSRGNSLRDLVTSHRVEEDAIDVINYEEDGEGALPPMEEARVASGSV